MIPGKEGSEMLFEEEFVADNAQWNVSV